MGRPSKKGLDYFPWDVGAFDDEKVQLISSEFGFKGEIVYIRLLSKIYKSGYFYQWGGDESLLFAKWVGNGITCSAVDEIVKGLVRRSLFDKRVFEKFNVLTSTNIQETYIFICKQLKRGYEIEPKYDCTKLQLLKNEFPPEKSGFSQEKTPVNSGENYTKERKGKEIKGKENELRSRTIENDLWLEDACRLSGREHQHVVSFCEAFITKQRMSGGFEKYEWGALARWMIEDLQKTKGDGKQTGQVRRGHDIGAIDSAADSVLRQYSG